MDTDTETILEMKLGKRLIARFRRLSRWMLVEDLEYALENRLKLLERA